MYELLKDVFDGKVTDVNSIMSRYIGVAFTHRGSLGNTNKRATKRSTSGLLLLKTPLEVGGGAI